jgi:SAM-dependent methyltransferase
VLEVGCANGRLLNGLKRAGFEVAGIEVSEQTAAVARDELGLDVRAGLLGELPLPRRYDALILRHVIEHVADPLALMHAVRDALTHDGVVVLVTPNRQSCAARVLGPRWEWFIPPLHLHYFTGAALAALGERAGFDLAWISSRRGDARPLADEVRDCAAGLDHAGEPATARRLRWLGGLSAWLTDRLRRTSARHLFCEELVTVLRPGGVRAGGGDA